MEEIEWKLQTLNRRLSLSLKRKVDNMKLELNKIMKSKVMASPLDMFRDARLRQDYLIKQLENNIKLEIKNKRLELVKKSSTLDGLSPLKTLARGYSIVESRDKKIIKSCKDLKKNDLINITLNEGNVEAKVL